MTSLRDLVVLVGASAFLVALSSGTVLTSLLCRLSWRWGAVDKPDGSLKCHVRPTATLGGISLFAAVLCGMGAVAILGPAIRGGFFMVNGTSLPWGSVLVAGLVILSVGISDDLRQVLPRTKLLFQMLAATVLIGSGLVIRRCDFFGEVQFSLGVLAVPFTLFWLVGSCNALNFIDGMDGLASGLGVVMALSLALLGFVNGAYGPAVVAVAVAGGLLAVLLFNVKPAMIFLGDSGSQLAGLLLGVLAIKTATVNGAFSLPSAGLILSVPIVDAFLSILRRYSAGRSPASGDHEHIHHCLRRRGLTVRETAVTLWLASLVCCMMGVASELIVGWWMALGAASFVAVELCLGVGLGCLDLGQLYQAIRGEGQRRQERAAAGNNQAELSALWDSMKPLFEQMQLDRVILTLERVTQKGRSDCETYQWVRDEALISELLRNRWTKRFPLGGDKNRIATLRLESAEQMRRDEQRIDLLLQQISENMRTVAQPVRPGTEAEELVSAAS